MFAVAAAAGIASLGRRGRHDVVTALALVLAGHRGGVPQPIREYSRRLFSLLFGEVLGVSTSELAARRRHRSGVHRRRRRPLPAAAARLGRPRHRRSPRRRTPSMDLAFLIVVAVVTALTVPVVGALLIFAC